MTTRSYFNPNEYKPVAKRAALVQEERKER